MALDPLVPVDTRALFRPVSASLVALLRTLPLQDWERPTVAGAWVVRDVVAHLLDSTLRRLSFHRDRMPPPPRAISPDRDFVAFINDLNAQWVTAAKRLSPRVLTDLYDRASRDAADWFESLPIDAPALFPVSWAGEQASAGWFDVGREFTELWHHQQQIADGHRRGGPRRPALSPRGHRYRSAGSPARLQERARGAREHARDRNQRRRRRSMDADLRGVAMDALVR